MLNFFTMILISLRMDDGSDLARTEFSVKPDAINAAPPTCPLVVGSGLALP